MTHRHARAYPEKTRGLKHRRNHRRSWQRFGNRGFAPLLVWGGLIGLTALAGYWGAGVLGKEALTVVLAFADFFSNIALTAVQQVFLWLGTLAAQLINIFTNLNPFDANTLAPFIWNTFRNIAYVIIIFLSLYTGFLWILGNDGPAKDLLWKLLIVAFIINFSFLIAREIYAVSFVITNSLAKMFCPQNQPGASCNRVGTAIHTSLLTFLDKSVVDQIKDLGQSNASGGGAYTDAQPLYTVIAKLIGVTLFAIYSAIMFILAMLFVGRFVFITLLVGLLPLAVIAWATPWHRGKWNQWWEMFLRWTVNIPILLLLVLIGFSIISASFAIGSNGLSFTDSLQRFIDPTALGLLPQDQTLGGRAQAYVGMIRFIFIAVYYAFAIGVAQSLGGGFATFGLNFAKGSWLAMGGAAVAGGKWGFRKKVAEPLSGFIDSAGDKMLERGIGHGQLLKNVAGGLKKSKKEDVKNITKARVDAALRGKDPNAEIEKLLINNKDDTSALREIIGNGDINWDTSDWVRFMTKNEKEMFGGKNGDKNRSIFQKKTRVVSATTKEEATEAVADANLAKIGFRGALDLLRPNLQANRDEIARNGWIEMSDAKKQSYASELSNLGEAKAFGFSDNEAYIKGFVEMFELRPIMEAAGGKLQTALKLIAKEDDRETTKAEEKLDQFAVYIAGLSPAEKTVMKTAIDNAPGTRQYIDEILSNATITPRNPTTFAPTGPPRPLSKRSLIDLGI